MKIAIVTGASSGMGREFVRQIADRFSGVEEIWAAARRKDRLMELAREVPVRVRAFDIDLTDFSDMIQLDEALREERPEVKLLVNAAGFGKIGAVGSISMEDETDMVRLNCEAMCSVTHMVLPYLTCNSRIIQFASSAAFLPQPNFAIYAATKAFVLSYSRALNEELKEKGIYVTAVCPGPVKTEFFDIAETTGKIALYKRFVMADPKKVVRQAIKESMMGRPVSVYGGVMNAFRLLAKCLPHGVILRFMRAL